MADHENFVWRWLGRISNLASLVGALGLGTILLTLVGKLTNVYTSWLASAEMAAFGVGGLAACAAAIHHYWTNHHRPARALIGTSTPARDDHAAVERVVELDRQREKEVEQLRNRLDESQQEIVQLRDRVESERATNASLRQSVEQWSRWGEIAKVRHAEAVRYISHSWPTLFELGRALGISKVVAIAPGSSNWPEPPLPPADQRIEAARAVFTKAVENKPPSTDELPRHPPVGPETAGGSASSD